MEKEHFECRACGNKSVVRFLNFGKMPVTNNYPTKESLSKHGEYLWDAAVGYCTECHMVQLTNFVPYDKYIIPNKDGKTDYAFHSSLSMVMMEHFKLFAQDLERRFLQEGDIVADIGGNDGIMLQHFSSKIKKLNIEPASNVAQMARKRGIESVEEFFTPELADTLVKEKGKFKAIASSNVILNIHDLNGVALGIKKMISEKGVFAMQDPYLVEILKDNAFDQFYEEHVWCFSLTSLSNFFKKHGLEVFDAELHPVHGGSMRVFVSNTGVYEKTKRLIEYLDKEKVLGLNTLTPYLNFSRNVTQIRDSLKNLLLGLKKKGNRIVGYAAACKGTLILNFSEIGKDILDYVVDSTPDKQGKLIPGVHIPIISPEEFKKDNPDYVLLGARNHATEIMRKESKFIEAGGKFIVPIPEPKIINDNT